MESNRINQNQNLPTESTGTWRGNSALSSLSASYDKQHVVVAGREVLKVLRVDSETKAITEEINLRAGLNVNINFACGDVKWAGVYAKNTIATATKNGSVIIWDISRSLTQRLDRILTEHTRTVNRIAFHPFEPSFILSGSQDGSMRLWDLRAKGIARHVFEGKAESVRDVQFSPTGAFEFAAAFENGNIQKWDVRNPSTFERKWSAHNGLALTIDWSPSGKHIASGGRDRVIKVWDVKSFIRKPAFTIQTIAPVTRVAWRPEMDTHIASSSLSTDFRVLVWDLGRPFVADRALDCHESVTTGFQWIDTNTIWSVSKDRTFSITSTALSYRPINLLTPSCSSWNSYGDIAFSVQKRESKDDSDEKKGKEKVDLTKLPIYIPDQKTGILETDGFDYESFVGMANGFVVDDKDVAESCRINADISIQQEQFRTAQTWKILGLIYGGKDPESRNLTKLFGGRDRRQQSPVPFENIQEKKPDNQEKLEKHEKILEKKEGLVSGDERNPNDSSLPHNITPLNNEGLGISTASAITSNIAITTALNITTETNPSNLTTNSLPTGTIISQSPKANKPPRPSKIKKRDQLFLNINTISLPNPKTSGIPGKSPSVTSQSPIEYNEADDEGTGKKHTPISNPVLPPNVANEFNAPDPPTSPESGWDTGRFKLKFGTTIDNNPLSKIRIKPNKKNKINDPPRQKLRKRLHNSHFQKFDEDDSSCSEDEPSIAGIDDDDDSEPGAGDDCTRSTSESDNEKMMLSKYTNKFERIREPKMRDGGGKGPDEKVVEEKKKADGGYEDFLVPFWEYEDVVYEMLDYYSEIGNVQVCVTIILVLRNFIHVKPERQEQWLWSYIDLLHRFQLWTVSNQIISQSGVAIIKQLNQESTVMHTLCHYCYRNKSMIYPSSSTTNTSSLNVNSSIGPNNSPSFVPVEIPECRITEFLVPNKSSYCEKCGKCVGSCSLCHQMVKGLYMWCQYCSHGGHLDCMKEWFSNNVECPSGCGHSCI